MQIGEVIAVSRSEKHTFSKGNAKSITLVKDHGVEGDAHFGRTVKHRSRVKQNPNQPNLRQVHLIHSELLEDLKEQFDVQPGEMGENITTQGINLLELPKDTILHIGESVVIQVTGLRNPCKQLDNFKSGLMNALIDKDEQGKIIPKAGIMGIVIEGGEIHADDQIRVELPSLPYKSLERV